MLGLALGTAQREVLEWLLAQPRGDAPDTILLPDSPQLRVDSSKADVIELRAAAKPTGLAVAIIKTAEDAESATYRFEGSAYSAGMLRFSKQDGQATLLSAMPGDEKGHHFDRAAAKLRKKWRSGELPDVTEWAS